RRSTTRPAPRSTATTPEPGRLSIRGSVVRIEGETARRDIRDARISQDGEFILLADQDRDP
ncbi:hypothetical protein ACTMTF_45345, partial [Nonomuraea sp. ZG12]|uniref:hypothetical protein n=1 Tax=Nonomuraea sp. ZG12 TaxID=3452207 RepID=UPI003F8AF940